jgi:hypothetical protein
LTARPPAPSCWMRSGSGKRMGSAGNLHMPDASCGGIA